MTEFYVRYQKFTIDDEMVEEIEGTAFEAMISGRHCTDTLFGLPRLDREVWAI